MSEVFPSIPKIKYEGEDSKNPMAFKYYNPEEKLQGKTIKEYLRFAMAYWHTLSSGGKDMFGDEAWKRPWDGMNDKMAVSKLRLQANFELTEKLSIPFYCFHDRDIAPEGDTLRETNKNLDEIVKLAKDYQKSSPTKLLWGTANCFGHPRYMHGAGTSPNAKVFAHAAAQIKKAIEVTKELGGENYVFWGGREGYETLLNTDMGLELDNFARLLRMAVDYAKEIGFTGQFLIEPKPKEPTKHQYDSDSAAVYGFLKKYDLLPYFKLNIETNHATLAGHTAQHELAYARLNGILGSVDANQGDELLGWDTDQFPTNLYVSTLMMYEVVQNGGLGKGGLNFDAKPRRSSFTVDDIATAHIAGMDGFARGLKIADALYRDKALLDPLAERYSSWKSGLGASIVAGKEDFKSLEKAILDEKDFGLKSGRQELLEAIVNQYI
jgi:xylose isomerase